MTGGTAYVYDRENNFSKRMNPQLVRAERIAADEDEARLRDLVQQHVDAAGSTWARELLDRWKETRNLFWKVISK